jgi:hypothetical protein
MIDYKYGKIYKVFCNITKQVYIGSTARRLMCYRKADHIHTFRRWEKGEYKYISVFEVMKSGDYSFTVVEDYPCNSADELRIRERYWIENTPNCVNINPAYKSKEEIRARMVAYEISRKDVKKSYLEEYRKTHRENAKESARQQRIRQQFTRELSNYNV